MDNRTRVLVVDDDGEIRRLLGRYLNEQGIAAVLAGSRRECEQKIASLPLDIVVLDVMLPDGSGLDVCRHIKDRHPDLAVILLTALKEEIDRIVGLEIGADDYLGKPINPRELAARIRAVLRRGTALAEKAATGAPAFVYRFAGYEAHRAARRVVAPDGSALDLTGGEFDLLLAFLDQPGRVLSRALLAERLHGRGADPADRAIDVAMSRLRRKFGDGGTFRLFKTIRNGGYQFAVNVEREEVR